VEEELDALPEQVKPIFLSQGAETFLNELISKELLYQEAKRQGLDKDKRLKRDMEEFRKVWMVKRLLQEKIEKEAKVPDEEARKYYDANRDDFRVKVPGAGRAELLSFDAVKDLIKQRLASEKQEKVFTAYIEDLKKAAAVDINEEALKDLSGFAGTANAPVGNQPAGSKRPAVK
jgi:peptidyl-prolyl cis-trans isomerase C